MNAIANKYTTAQLLVAGKATFTLEGKGRRWTFRISECDDKPGLFFASMLTGPDNESDYQYIGIYQPDTGWLKLTRASKLQETSEPIRGFRWLVGLVFNNREAEIEEKGFRILWSTHCQRCGKTLTVPSSVDNRLGPECAKKM